jgi:AcrR family transcriptional regulator
LLPLQIKQQAEIRMSLVKKGKTSKLDLILREAAKLFRQKGFGGTSMRDLAEQVGMEAASMYYHIGSKDEILEKICFEIANKYIGHLEEIEQTKEPYLEKLKKLIGLHVSVMITNGPEVSVTNHDWKYLSKDKLNEFKELRKFYEKRLEVLLEEGIKAGELAEVNTSVALFTILSSLRWIEFWWKPQRGISAKEVESSIITILLAGLEKKA